MDERERRPLGLTLLALLAFAASAFLAIVPISIAISFLRDYHENPQDLSGYLGLSIAVLCLLTLAGISIVAGVDLLRLKRRGRSLAVVSTIFISLLGMTLTVAGILDRIHDWELFSVSLTLCAVSMSALLYLYLPTVRKKFAAPPRADLD
jgi:MFS family permease